MPRKSRGRIILSDSDGSDDSDVENKDNNIEKENVVPKKTYKSASKKSPGPGGQKSPIKRSRVVILSSSDDDEEEDDEVPSTSKACLPPTPPPVEILPAEPSVADLENILPRLELRPYLPIQNIHFNWVFWRIYSEEIYSTWDKHLNKFDGKYLSPILLAEIFHEKINDEDAVFDLSIFFQCIQVTKVYAPVAYGRTKRRLVFDCVEIPENSYLSLEERSRKLIAEDSLVNLLASCIQEDDHLVVFGDIQIEDSKTIILNSRCQHPVTIVHYRHDKNYGPVNLDNEVYSDLKDPCSNKQLCHAIHEYDINECAVKFFPNLYQDNDGTALRKNGKCSTTASKLLSRRMSSNSKVLQLSPLKLRGSTVTSSVRANASSPIEVRNAELKSLDDESDSAENCSEKGDIADISSIDSNSETDIDNKDEVDDKVHETKSQVKGAVRRKSDILTNGLVIDKTKDPSLKNCCVQLKRLAESVITTEETPGIVQTGLKALKGAPKSIEKAPKLVEKELKLAETTPKVIKTSKLMEKTPKEVEKILAMKENTPEAMGTTPKAANSTRKAVDKALEVVEKPHKIEEKTTRESQRTAKIAKLERKTRSTAKTTSERQCRAKRITRARQMTAAKPTLERATRVLRNNIADEDVYDNHICKEDEIDESVELEDESETLSDGAEIIAKKADINLNVIKTSSNADMPLKNCSVVLERIIIQIDH